MFKQHFDILWLFIRLAFCWISSCAKDCYWHPVIKHPDALLLQQISIVTKRTHNILLVMCDMYQYIKTSTFSFVIMIQYWLLGISIHWNEQFSKPGFYQVSYFTPKSKLCITFINFFYHFLTTTGQLFSISIIINPCHKTVF